VRSRGDPRHGGIPARREVRDPTVTSSVPTACGVHHPRERDPRDNPAFRSNDARCPSTTTASSRT
jgi:hypothetical protein